MTTLPLIVLASAAHLVGAQPEPAPIVRASAAEVLALGEHLERAGDGRHSRRLYQELLQDPSLDVRAEARFRIAMLDKNEGRLPEAAAGLRLLLLQAPDAQRARLELASLLMQMGDDQAASTELRRARSGRLPDAVARQVDRWSATLRARRPSGASLDVALAPDTNINRATSADTLNTLIGDFGIDADSKARSGVGASLRGQAWRKFRLKGERISIQARTSLATDLYRRADANHYAAAITLTPELHLARTALSLDVTGGQSWYAGKAYVRQLQLAGRARSIVGPRSLVVVSLAAARIDNLRNDLQDGAEYLATASLEQGLSATGGIVLSGAWNRLSARDPGYSTKSWRLGLSGWQELGPSTLFGGFEIGRLDADERLALFPEARRDRYTKVTVGLSATAMKFGGFSPLIRISRERNRSTIVFTDYARTRSEIGVTRDF